MSLVIPEELQDLESNCGIFAVWMLLQHYEMSYDLDFLLKVCAYQAGVGTFGIGLAVGLARLGFEVSFHTETDVDQHDNEPALYQQAQLFNIPVETALSYAQIQNAVALGAWVIVYYDTLDGVGNHSLIYDIDEQEIQFFDCFEAMPIGIFEQQRRMHGICSQAIVIRSNLNMQPETVIYS